LVDGESENYNTYYVGCWLLVGVGVGGGDGAVRIFVVGGGSRRNLETRATATAGLWGINTSWNDSSLPLRE